MTKLDMPDLWGSFDSSIIYITDGELKGILRKFETQHDGRTEVQWASVAGGYRLWFENEKWAMLFALNNAWIPFCQIDDPTEYPAGY